MHRIHALAVLVGLLAWQYPQPVFAGSCSEGSQPALRVVLVHHGDQMSSEDLDRVWEVLAPRFLEATGCQIRLARVATRIFPLKYGKSRWLIPSDLRPLFGGKKWPSDLTDQERARLARLRYYYAADGQTKIIDEIERGVRELDGGSYDALVVMTSAQFEGLGFGVPNQMAVTEQPSEIAWLAKGGGETKFFDIPRLVDELVHELGHVVGLNHASFGCVSLPEGTPWEEISRCCKTSPGANDVMSYCRERPKVSESFFFKFEACNQDKIRDVVVPRLLAGKSFSYEKTGCP